MDTWTIVGVIIIGLWALVATGRMLYLSAKLKKSRACIYVGHYKNGDKAELYLEAYDSPDNWKYEKQILVDIEYKEI